MKHPALKNLGSLQSQSEEILELAVDALIAESEYGFDDYMEARIARAEALAILAHEFRRREGGET